LPLFNKAIVAHVAESVGREAPSVMADVSWGKWIVGTAAMAAAGYAIQHRMKEGEQSQA
jgi:hypothetical protein